MKKILWMCALLLGGSVLAQETTPPTYQGADVQRFMTRLIGESMKIVEERNIPAGGLSAQVVVRCTIDTEGNTAQWSYLDNAQTDRDYYDVAPATEVTRQVLAEAVERLGRWEPAQKEGVAVEYRTRLSLRLPIEKIARKQEAEPLLFQGMDPDKTFHEWATNRTRFDDRFTEKGVEGLVRVKFYIEPNGRIVIGEVLTSPDEKLSKEVIRVIRSSKGLWTPRKVNGVAQRTSYEYGVNFNNN